MRAENRKMTRRFLTPPRAAGAVLGLLLALLAATVAAAPASAAAANPPRPEQYRGAQVHLMWSGVTTASVDRQLDLLAGLGSDSARLDVAWSSLEETGRGRWSLGYVSRLDYVIAGMERRGIRPVVVLTETPCWASTAPETDLQGCEGPWWERGVTKWAPKNPADFATAAAYVAARYGSRLAALELWNEPNWEEGRYANLRAPDKATAYTAMVTAAYPAVKRVAPQLPVLAGSLSFADTDFLRALYQRGMRGSYDGIAVHPYNEWRAPGAPHDPRWAKYDLVLGLGAVRAEMLARGDSSPVWVTELGWTTCTLGADRWCVTEAQQARYVADAVRLLADYSWVRAVLIYNLRDKGTDVNYTEDNFGLVTRSYREKPALASLRSALRELAAPAAPVTTMPPAAQLPAPPPPPLPAQPVAEPVAGPVAEPVPDPRPSPRWVRDSRVMERLLGHSRVSKGATR
jgi:polysaccharide biosynthesis protein PslG